jgi:chemotaxis family two-component system sensor kinase Cph1
MSVETELEIRIDTTNCDREPIHIPGAILPHGAMLVLDPDTFEIFQVAGDTAQLLGKPIAELLGESVTAILSSKQIAHLRAVAAKFDLTKPRHLLDPLMRIDPERPLDASVHRSGGSLVLEFEAADTEDRLAADPLAGVQEMIEGFDDAGSLQELCQLAAERVRVAAGYDRVLVYRFMHDESGWVIAEAREPHLEPFLDLHYPAADIPQQARALYVKSWLRLITQVDYDPAPLVPVNNPRTGAPLDMSYSILRDVSPIHRQYLRNMGIDASMSISIVLGGKLWGLIACHHYSPRLLPRHLRAVCELFGSMFSLQLESREKGEQLEERLASRMVLQNLMLNLASADDYAAGLTQQSPNLLDYIHGGGVGMDGARRGGVAVCVKGQLTFLGVTPSQPEIESVVAWLDTHMHRSDGVYATDRLGETWPPAKAFTDVASGILVISVSPEPSDYIIWFRPEMVTDVHWAGAPVKQFEPGPDGDRLMPRHSFELWKETVVGRSVQWTRADKDAAFDLRISLLHVVLRRIKAAARERKAASDRDQLLMAELDHRVKNTLANIQALVVQTSRSADTLTGFVEGLDGRIQSMAKAHSLLSESRWEGVSISRLLHEELDLYGERNHGIALHGPDFLLTSKSALALSLAMHELATNAAKYGSFTTTAGRVEVTWEVAVNGSIEVCWSESGGPVVAPPTRRGFGSTLIERALAMETGGGATISYLPTGVVCKISLPPSSISTLAVGPVLPEVVATGVAMSATIVDQYRILIVEDSFLLVMAIEDLFDRLGWKIIGPAARVDEAMALARTAEFDAALVDINLAGEMSWPVAAVLTERGIPFAFSSGYNVDTLLPASLQGTELISKPYRDGEVERCLRQIIFNHRDRQRSELAQGNHA